MSRANLAFATWLVYAILFIINFHFTPNPHIWVWLVMTLVYWCTTLALAPHFKWVHCLTLPGFVLLPWQLHWANAFHNALDAAWLHAILASQPKVVLTLLQERVLQITLPSFLLFTLWLGLLIAWWRVDAHSPKRALPRNQSWRIPTIALAVLLAGCILILQQPLPTEAPNFVKALQHFFWFGYTASHASALSQPWPFGFYISLIQLFFLRV